MKKYKIPSRSEKGKFRIVEERWRGKYFCDCPAYKECYHIRLVKRYKREVMSNPSMCWYSHDVRHLEEHHLMRGNDRPVSLSIFITHWVHKIATHDNDFANHLIDLFFKSLNKKNMDIKVKVKIETAVIKPSVEEIKIIFKSEDVENAFKFAKLKPTNLVLVRNPKTDERFYCIIDRVKKTKNQIEAEIKVEVAPAEIVNCVPFCHKDDEVEISFKDI
jgi:hypothetical protein